jgi:hypothetical protein
MSEERPILSNRPFHRVAEMALRHATRARDCARTAHVILGRPAEQCGEFIRDRRAAMRRSAMLWRWADDQLKGRNQLQP